MISAVWPGALALHSSGTAAARRALSYGEAVVPPPSPVPLPVLSPVPSPQGGDRT